MNTRPGMATALALLAVGCASEAPEPASFDSSKGVVQVEIGGDGFARLDGRRLPLEAVVLELRWQTRPMSRDERLQYVVRVGAADVADEAGKAAQRDAIQRFFDELELMGVKQIQLF